MKVIGTTQVLTLPLSANLPVSEVPAKPFCTLLAVIHFNALLNPRNNFCLQRKKFHLVTELKLHGQTTLRKWCLCFPATTFLETMVRDCNMSKTA
jgi:hypothetical protein